VTRGSDTPGDGVGEGAATSAGFDDNGAGAEVELAGDVGDVGEIEDLGAVGEDGGPELRGGVEEVDEATAGVGGEFTAVFEADHVVVAEDTVFVVVDVPGLDIESEGRFAVLFEAEGVSRGYERGQEAEGRTDEISNDDIALLDMGLVLDEGHVDGLAEVDVGMIREGKGWQKEEKEVGSRSGL
jgi:hypothetical protein